MKYQIKLSTNGKDYYIKAYQIRGFGSKIKLSTDSILKNIDIQSHT